MSEKPPGTVNVGLRLAVGLLALALGAVAWVVLALLVREVMG
jgi:hypothetical protein